MRFCALEVVTFNVKVSCRSKQSEKGSKYISLMTYYYQWIFWLVLEICSSVIDEVPKLVCQSRHISPRVPFKYIFNFSNFNSDLLVFPISKSVFIEIIKIGKHYATSQEIVKCEIILLKGQMIRHTCL